MEDKIFTRKQKWQLLGLIVVLAGVWFCLAYFIKECLLERFTLWATLVFGTGTLITSTVALGISILTFRREEKDRKQRIRDDANKFIKENNEEIQYIPLCLMANVFDNHHGYRRKIYNEFNVLNREQQKEVLNQLNYSFNFGENNKWIESTIERIREYIKLNDLGNDCLYENAKYFYKSLEYSEMEFDDIQSKPIMRDLFHWQPKIFFRGNSAFEELVSFSTFLASYLTEKRGNSKLYILHKEEKPIDVLAAYFNFGMCPEYKACDFVMLVVFTIAIQMMREMNKGQDDLSFYLSRSDASIETMEDRFLEVLMELYNLNLTLKRDKVL